MTTKKYHYIKIKLRLTKKQMILYVGDSCLDFDEFCFTCISWKEWNKNKSLTVAVDRARLLDALTAGEL
jgi:hypothetical protein